MRIFIPVLTLLLASCVSKHEDAISKPAAPETHAPRQPLLGLAPGQVSELELIKDDPTRADHWTARITLSQNQCKLLGSDHRLGDRACDTAWVRHFLETVQTIQDLAQAPELGEPTLRLRIDRKLVLLLAVGADGSTRAQIGDAPPFQAQGAMFRMLEYLNGFDALRKKTLLGPGLARAELRVPGGGKARNAKNTASTRAWFEKIEHLRIKSFIDEPGPLHEALSELEAHPIYEVRLRGDRQKSVTLALGGQGRVLASVSDRPGAVFELFPESLLAIAQIPHGR